MPITPCELFFNFDLEVVENYCQTFLELNFGPFSAECKSTFGDISRLRLKLSKSSHGALDKLFSKNLRL